MKTSDLFGNLIRLHQANNNCKHPAQITTDPYSQPGMGQDHPSQPSSTGTLQTLNFRIITLQFCPCSKLPATGIGDGHKPGHHRHDDGHQPGDHRPAHQQHSSTRTQSGSQGDAVLPHGGVDVHLLPHQGPQLAVGLPEPDHRAHEVHPRCVHVQVWGRRNRVYKSPLRYSYHIRKYLMW
jgi:hypothetical protein